MITRAKFTCDRITTYKHGLREVVMSPVMGAGCEENKKFWEYTPSGEIKINITGKCASNFVVGADYYIDFTLIEDPEKSDKIPHNDIPGYIWVGHK